MEKKIIAFMICIVSYQISQGQESDTLKYAYISKYIRSDIALCKTDSSYRYHSWSHTGFYVIDTGVWDYKCDMLIFNSSITYKGNSKAKKRDKLMLTSKIFINSCFIYRGDSIIEETRNRNYVFRRVRD